MKCISCGKEFRKGVTFICPSCNKEHIERCSECKQLVTEYKCRCSFEGP